MTFKLDPRRCPICGHNRGYGQPDHTACARNNAIHNQAVQQGMANVFANHFT
jgi:hypothetical protein